MKKDYGNALLISAIAVGAPRWAGAMLSADVGEVTGLVSNILNVMNVLSGLAMGPLEVFAAAYMLDALRKQKPTTRAKTKSGYRTKINFKWWGVLFFSVGLLILTPAILAPFIMSRMNNTGMVGVLPDSLLQLAWSTFVTIAPLFLVGGVAFAHAGLVADDSQGSQKSGTSYPRKCTVPGCDYVAENRYAWAAHQKSHEKKE